MKYPYNSSVMVQLTVSPMDPMNKTAEAPTISYPTTIPSIETSTNDKKLRLRVEFKDKKTAWKRKNNIHI